MFRRALLQQTRQFSSKTVIPRSSLVVPPVRQWQATPSFARLRRTISTTPASEPAPPAEEPKAEETTGSNGNGNTDNTTASASATVNGNGKDLETLQKELDKMTEEAKFFKEKLKWSAAEFCNLQKRIERDKKAARDFAIQKFAQDLIESVDNLERALSTVPEESRSNPTNKELVDFYDGLKITEDILLKTLQKHGLEKVNPIGEIFDPNRHEATFQVAVPDKDPNTVFHVQQTGFVLNGRTIRAAKVGIVADSK